MTKSVLQQDKGIRLTTPSGESYFNYYWLRDNCPDSFDSQTRERTFDICTLSHTPQSKSVEINEDTLTIHWKHEDHISHFSVTWLERWAQSGRRADPALMSRKLWYADHYQSLARFSKTDLVRNKGSRLNWAKSLLVDGIAVVTEMGNHHDSLTELVHLLGEIRSSVAGNFFDVQIHLDPVNLSYTAHALEFHTDTPAEELPPGIQFLHCIENSVSGGDTLFMDGVAAAEDFKTTHPADFNRLISTTIPFYYEHNNFDWRSRQRIIETDDNDQISGVTISRHMADIIDLPQQELDDFYPAYHRFGQLILDPKYHIKFRINQGECVVFDNHRIVHARDAYSSNNGKRHLRGCYVDRGELRSTYRTLLKQGYGQST